MTTEALSPLSPQALSSDLTQPTTVLPAVVEAELTAVVADAVTTAVAATTAAEVMETGAIVAAGSDDETGGELSGDGAVSDDDPVDLAALLAARSRAGRIAAAAPNGHSRNAASITAISFSLTFVLVSFALLAGVVPASLITMPVPVDLGVMLLIVPLCALVFAIMAEALRAALRGVPAAPAPRTATALADWRPGHGEG